MNEWNYMETRVRSWTARQPSPKLARKLFGAGPQNNSAEALHQSAWALVAAAACLVLMTWVQLSHFSLGRRMVMPSPGLTLMEPGILAAMALGQENFASINLEQNILQRLTVDWTNDALSFTAPGPLEVALTNRLRQ